MDAVQEGLHRLDSRAVAALLKELAKNGLPHRAAELFDWLRSLPPDHALARLADLYTYTTIISQVGGGGGAQGAQMFGGAGLALACACQLCDCLCRGTAPVLSGSICMPGGHSCCRRHSPPGFPGLSWSSSQSALASCSAAGTSSCGARWS